MSRELSETEELLNNALRLIVVYLIESKTEGLNAQLMSDGEFYAVDIKIRKIVE